MSANNIPLNVSDLRESQLPSKWKAGRDHLFNEWVHNADCEDAVRHVWDEMASFDEEMWVRSCREIEKAYQKWSLPLERIAAGSGAGHFRLRRLICN